MVVMMFMFMTMIVMVLMTVMSVGVVMVMFVVILIVVIIFFVAFYAADPCGRRGDTLEVEHSGVEYVVEVDAGVVALDDARSGLYGADDGLEVFGLVTADF